MKPLFYFVSLLAMNFVSLQLFAVILSRVTTCLISIVLWFPVWNQYFALLMLDYCWGYHCKTKNKTRKIQHAYNIKMQHPYNTHFTPYGKYNIKWAFWVRVQMHWRDIIPYQTYVYIEIYCIQNKPIHCNEHF